MKIMFIQTIFFCLKIICEIYFWFWKEFYLEEMSLAQIKSQDRHAAKKGDLIGVYGNEKRKFMLFVALGEIIFFFILKSNKKSIHIHYLTLR